MKSFFKNVLANIVGFAIIMIILFIGFIMMIAVSAASSSTPKVKSNSVLVIDEKLQVLDSPTDENFSFFSMNNESKDVLLFDLLTAINKAKTDDKIKGISIEADYIAAGITQLDDIRAALEDFKKSGKFVYAYGNAVTQPAYYLGSVAQQYYLHPAGGIDLKGLATEVTFFKDFADKYGIGIEVIRHGKYKSAVEPYLRNDISPENKEQLSTLLNDIWGNTLNKIAVSRKIDSTQLNVVVDSLYGMLPNLTVQHKLADKLLQKSEYTNMLKNKLNVKDKEKLNTISMANYVESVAKEEKGKERVAVLYASGAIYNGKDYKDIHSERYLKYIKELQEDDKVKAVVLRVNSPGGSANASDEILFALKELKKKKPLVVSFGDYAASGGYYIAMGADKIYSEPNTLTGSIGVFGVLYNFEDVANKNGIRSDVVSTNDNAAYYSMLHGLTPHGRAMITKSVEGTYKRFVGFVTENRKKTFEQIDNVGGGRVWSGTRAKELGLVDELGTLQNAIQFAAQKAGLKKYDVEAFPRKKSKFEQILGNMNEDDISSKVLQNKVGKDHYKVIEQFINLKTNSEVKMELPYRIIFK